MYESGELTAGRSPGSFLSLSAVWMRGNVQVVDGRRRMLSKQWYTLEQCIHLGGVGALEMGFSGSLAFAFDCPNENQDELVLTQ